MVGPNSFQVIQIVAARLREMKASLCLTVLCMLGGTALELLAPWPLKIIFDYVLLERPLPPSLSFLDMLLRQGPLMALAILSFSIALMAVVGGGLSYFQTSTLTKAGYQVVHSIRRELFAHLQRLSLSFHDKVRSGEMLSMLSSDTSALREVVAEAVLPLAGHLLLFTGMLLIMFSLNWQLSLVVLLTLPALIGLLVIFNSRIRVSTYRLRKREGELAARMSEVLSSVALVQAFGREGHEMNRLDSESEQHLKEGILTVRNSATVTRSIGAVSAIGTAGTVMFGAWLVLQGRLTPGDLLIFVAYVKNLYRPIRDISHLSLRTIRALVSIERLGQILNIEPAIHDHPDAVWADDLKGGIVFRDVSFAYDGSSKALDRVSFEIHPGERVALVGESGAGKSTIVSLLLRLYEPQEGTISIDAVDIRDYRCQSLRNAIGIALQDSFLLGVSIAENISYGKLDATRDEIEEAARLAHAHDFIAALPNGYDTILGEQGCTLSGGQRKRISLARAMIKRPSILILDEPVSGVDPMSASLISDAVAQSQKGKTTLVIAHRYTDMRQFDQILVLRHGRIVECGPHHQLLAGRGHYYNLLSHQMGERQWAQEDDQLKPVHSQGEMKKHA